MDVDVAGQKIYWGTSGSEIRSGPITGGVPDAVPLLSTGLNVRGVCFDAANSTLYWCEKDAGSIFKRQLPNGTTAVIYNGQNAPHGLVLDLPARKLYWVDSGTNSGGFNPMGISRGDMDGSTPAEKIMIGTTANQPWDLDLDTRHATYAEWTTRFFRLDATSNAKLAATDNEADGISNLLEYAFEGAPGIHSPEILPTATTVVDGGTPYPALRFRRRPAPSDLTYKFQTSSDLIDWADDQSVLVSSELRASGDFETVTMRSSTPASAPNARQYLRVKVSLVP